MRVVMILAAESEADSNDGAVKTSLADVAAPYYALRDAGIEVVLASPKGGAPLQIGMEDSKAEIRRLRGDREALDEFNDTLRLDRVYVEDFDGAFLASRTAFRAGRHVDKIVSTLLAQHKPVAITSGSLAAFSNETFPCGLIVGQHGQSPLETARALIQRVCKGNEK
jgi:putative intracellular protease/amidase